MSLGQELLIRLIFHYNVVENANTESCQSEIFEFIEVSVNRCKMWLNLKIRYVHVWYRFFVQCSILVPAAPDWGEHHFV